MSLPNLEPVEDLLAEITLSVDFLECDLEVLFDLVLVFEPPAFDLFTEVVDDEALESVLPVEDLLDDLATSLSLLLDDFFEDMVTDFLLVLFALLVLPVEDLLIEVTDAEALDSNLEPVVPEEDLLIEVGALLSLLSVESAQLGNSRIRFFCFLVLLGGAEEEADADKAVEDVLEAGSSSVLVAEASFSSFSAWSSSSVTELRPFSCI